MKCLQPDRWGLYDTLGNVWEWVADWFHGNYVESERTDPSGPKNGDYRTVRGGSWFYEPKFVRVSNRGFIGPDAGDDDIGFRCVWEP